MSPFSLGAQAFRDGKKQYQNPYEFDSEDCLKHQAWLRGYRYAYGGGV